MGVREGSPSRHSPLIDVLLYIHWDKKSSCSLLWNFSDRYFLTLAFLQKMQESKREEVSKLLKSNATTSNEIAERCQISLKTVYNVRTRISKSRNLKHCKGAGRPAKLSKNSKISLTHSKK